MKFIALIIILAIPALAVSTPPTAVRVTPDSLPAYIVIEITPTSCTEKREPGYEGIWYATVKAKIADIDVQNTQIRVMLRDADSDMFLFNPGTHQQVENGFLLHGIAFNEVILDQVLFEFREGMKAAYLIYLRDFYDGEPC